MVSGKNWIQTIWSLFYKYVHIISFQLQLLFCNQLMKWFQKPLLITDKFVEENKETQV